MESWMISVFIAISGVVGTYSVLNYKVSRMELDFKDHRRKDDVIQSDLTSKINSGFKRLDECSDRVIVLEQDAKNFLDLSTAELKFVTRKELELHLDKIEIITRNTNKDVNLLMGKQNDILTLLQEMRVK